ncbi:MAG: GNAT family N-acetyltransferase [Mogibacterium sp.]|nr:GNAT family N-acetyltransferase [Mogibacterium sp.]
MKFRKADAGDIPVIVEIYDRTHVEEEAGNTTVGWKRGIYPTQKVAEDSVARGDMYVAETEGKVVATGIINQEQVDVYADCDWKYKVPDDEVAVLHTLAVDPGAKGRGIGPGFVGYYEQLAKEWGCEVLRIDTNETNTAARTMYKKLGYIESGIVPTVFNGLKDINLVLLEKKL